MYNFPSCSIWDITVKPHHADSFRSIIHIKNELLEKVGSVAQCELLLQSWIKGGKLDVSSAYDWFRMPMEKLPSLAGLKGVTII